MFCDECQKILDLDILISTWTPSEPNTRQDKAFPHHESLIALEVSAKAGCKLCKLAVSAAKGKRVARLRSLTGNDARIFFQLSSDDILCFKTAHCPAPPEGNALFVGIKLRASEGDPVTKIAPNLFTSRPLAEDISSEPCFRLATYWLKTCLDTHHERCPVIAAPLPTRVLDVGQLVETSVSLHISSGEIGEWITLSHCWGSQLPSMTTMKNLDSRREGILVTDLPQSFQDAVLITRKLGYRFLWMDCLCIIQDSVDDWQAESVKMAEIYSNAILNISADAAADSYKGIFSSANNSSSGLSTKDFKVGSESALLPVHSPARNINTTLLACVWAGGPDPNSGSILRTRAWAFQEAALSRRRLRYIENDILWSCGTVHDSCTEMEPHHIHDVDSEKSYRSSIYHIPHEAMPSEYDPSMSPKLGFLSLCWWYHQVNNYASRFLTFPGDRFPAMSGLAKEFSERTGYHYKAGVWLEDFHRRLLWRNYGGGINLDISPSWSWGVLLGNPENSRIYHSGCGMWQFIDAEEAVLLGMIVSNTNDNPFGQVISASLCLRSLHHSLKDMWPKHDFHFGSGFRRRNKNYEPARIHPDHRAIRLFIDVDKSMDLFWQRRDVILLQVARFGIQGNIFNDGCDKSWWSEARESHDATFSLILEHTGASDATYRRIGVAKMPDSGSEEIGWEMKTVTII